MNVAFEKSFGPATLMIFAENTAEANNINKIRVNFNNILRTLSPNEA
jgi:hypothetical protein